jgi:hypothetical protein
MGVAKVAETFQLFNNSDNCLDCAFESSFGLAIGQPYTEQNTAASR